MSDENAGAEVARLREEVASLRAKVEGPRRRRWLPLTLAVVLFSTLASAQLVTFAADQPAVADQVNANFTQLKTWLEQQVGTVGTNTITTGTLTLGAGGPSQTTLSAGPSGVLSLGAGLVLPEGASRRAAWPR